MKPIGDELSFYELMRLHDSRVFDQAFANLFGMRRDDEQIPGRDDLDELQGDLPLCEVPRNPVNQQDEE
jgi:hypothetical protein